MIVAERLRTAVAAEPFVLHGTGKKIPVTISIGVAVAEETGDTVEKLLNRADEALYAAKNCGRNRVVSHGAETPIAPLVSLSPVAIAS
jgi:two-component system cell cycle response regulator